METILITGANGEVGHVLISEFAKQKKYALVALDIQEIDESLKPLVHENIVANILDKNVIENILKEHKISRVFHLAGRLSTLAEKDPERAHEVNVDGTFTLLSAVNKIAEIQKQVIKFIFPSSIAVYGLPNLETKQRAGKVKEEDFNDPITMYGINKLYCENLGKYYSSHYSLLATNISHFVDFRCVRFPGLISAMTIPTGGTSDYGAEMVHAAAKGEGYESFVRPDTQLPFMVMPDAVKALIQLNEVSKEKLKRLVYNVGSFSVTAGQIAELVNKVFPDSSISYNPDQNRQKIVDSWPTDIDDSRARTDWDWQPDYDINHAFSNYLIPEVQNKYNK